jgi:hypothetical protein
MIYKNLIIKKEYFQILFIIKLKLFLSFDQLLAQNY